MNRKSGPLGKKPNINAYSDMLKEMKKKYQPEAYAKSEAVKKSREDYRNSPEAAEKFKDMASYTPLFPVVTGKNMYDAYKKGDTDEMIAEGVASTAVGLGSMFLPPLAMKAIKSGYKGLKNLFKGPLSPQYNAEGMNPKKMIKEQAKEMLKKILAPLSEKPTKAQRDKMEDMIEAKLELQKDYPDSDIIFQHSMNPNRDINNFRSRPVNVPNKAAFGKGPGLFGHGLTDANKFEQFGPNVYAIVYPKKTRVFPGKMDTESNLDEIFVRTPDIEDLVKVNLRGQKWTHHA